MAIYHIRNSFNPIYSFFSLKNDEHHHSSLHKESDVTFPYSDFYSTRKFSRKAIKRTKPCINRRVTCHSQPTAGVQKIAYSLHRTSLIDNDPPPIIPPRKKPPIIPPEISPTIKPSNCPSKQTSLIDNDPPPIIPPRKKPPIIPPEIPPRIKPSNCPLEQISDNSRPPINPPEIPPKKKPSQSNRTSKQTYFTDNDRPSLIYPRKKPFNPQSDCTFEQNKLLKELHELDHLIETYKQYRLTYPFPKDIEYYNRKIQEAKTKCRMIELQLRQTQNSPLHHTIKAQEIKEPIS